jgi:photosystem II cytochrome c550
MFKKYIWLIAITLFFAFQSFVGGAIAAELDAATRTVQSNAKGENVVLSAKQVVQGKRMFNYACGQCHVGGVTNAGFGNPSS